MMIYDCPIHGQKFQKGKKLGCKDCINICKRLEAPKKYPMAKISKLRPSVFWGKADELASGRVIENLGHKPQHFRSKDQLRDFMKRNRIQEAG